MISMISGHLFLTDITARDLTVVVPGFTIYGGRGREKRAIANDMRRIDAAGARLVEPGSG
jgi:hypothetical protein